MAEAVRQPVTVLHIAPGHVDVRPGQGSHKDVAARKLHLEQVAASYRYCNVNGDQPSQLEATLADFSPSHVLVEYSYFPRIVRMLRRRYPQARIAIRAHNIEPLQHWTLAGPGERDLLLPFLRCAYVTLRLFLADLQVGWMADRILLISPVEQRTYWRWPGCRARASWLPYLPPPEFIDGGARSERDVIACLPGATESVRTQDLVRQFSTFAERAKSAGWPETFVATGDLRTWDVHLSPAVTQTGHVDDLGAFYRKIAAVAILSPLGFGFKTTIGDAIASGAAVLAHPKIWQDLPEELKPYAVPVSSLDAAELMEAHAQLLRIPASSGAMAALNRRFEQEMTQFLGEGPR
jgi:hypothetical protein